MIPSIIVAVLAIAVLAVVAIVMAASTRGRLQRLEFRIKRLEERLGDAAAKSAPLPSVAPDVSPPEEGRLSPRRDAAGGRHRP